MLTTSLASASQLLVPACTPPAAPFKIGLASAGAPLDILLCTITYYYICMLRCLFIEFRRVFETRCSPGFIKSIPGDAILKISVPF